MLMLLLKDFEVFTHIFSKFSESHEEGIISKLWMGGKKMHRDNVMGAKPHNGWGVETSAGSRQAFTVLVQEPECTRSPVTIQECNTCHLGSPSQNLFK